MISEKVRAVLPDGSIRYYDGLAQNADGSYEGIAVKSGTATRDAGQRAFDGAVDAGTPAKAILNGKPIVIRSTDLIVVK